MIPLARPALLPSEREALSAWDADELDLGTEPACDCSAWWWPRHRPECPSGLGAEGIDGLAWLDLVAEPERAAS